MKRNLLKILTVAVVLGVATTSGAVFNDINAYPGFDITNIYGYGETKEEAVENLKKELEYYFNELHALERMLYETDVRDNDIIEVDCLGRKI